MDKEDPTLEDLKKAFDEEIRPKYPDIADAWWADVVESFNFINRVFDEREKLLKQYPKGFERLHALRRGDLEGFKKLQRDALKPGVQRSEDLQDALSLAILVCLDELQKPLEPTLAPLRKVTADLQHIDNVVTKDATNEFNAAPNSLDSPITHDTEALTFKDTLSEDIFSPEDLTEFLEMERLISLVSSLLENRDEFSDRERQVLSMRYPAEGERPTLEEVGIELAITKQSVHETEHRALKKLARHLKYFKP